MTLLSKPWKVDERGERLYLYVDGREVCADVCSGLPEDRRRVLALLAQVPHAMRLLRRITGGACNCTLGADETLCERCEAEKVLRDAGLMSGPGSTVEP